MRNRRGLNNQMITELLYLHADSLNSREENTVRMSNSQRTEFATVGLSTARHLESQMIAKSLLPRRENLN